jgi:hypothetical protein
MYRQRPPGALDNSMTGQVTGTDIFAGFGQSQVIADSSVLLIFERLAALRWPRR